MNYQNLFNFAAVFISFAMTAAAVQADTLVSNPWEDYPAIAFELKTIQDGTTTTQGVYSPGISVTNTDSNQSFKVFCSDFFTKTSGGFAQGGQKYNSSSLNNSPFHSEVQKGQLQSLFNHVYSKAFNDDYSVKNDWYSNLFQLAVWEIVNDTSEHLSLRDGDVQMSGIYYEHVNGSTYHLDRNGQYFKEAQGILDEWFDSIMNGTWDEDKWADDNYNLTVWIADGGSDKSQTFIGVAPTPEPATMLIFGLGIAGAAVARRRRKV